MKEYNIGEKSARDYVGRLNGVVEKGIYNEESVITPSMKMHIERISKFKKPLPSYLGMIYGV